MKKNTLRIVGIISTILVGLISGIGYLSHLLAVTTEFAYGPYDCNDSKLTVKQKIVYNKLAGAMSDMNISIEYKQYSFTTLVYPPASQETNNGMTSIHSMNEAQRDQFRRDTTSASLDLRTDIMESVVRKYGANNSRLPEDLLATTKLSETDFLDFKKCFDINTEDIYMNMILKTQDKHLGTAFSEYILFSRVYNAK